MSDEPVEALIFDFGGVLVDWDPRHLFRSFYPDPDELERFLGEVWTSAQNDRCDRGRPFAEMIDELVAAHPSHEQAIRASAPEARWVEMVPRAIPGMVDLLAELASAGYRLCSLSNFSSETFPLVRHRFACFDLLDDIVISGSLDGIGKPDREAFELVAARNDLDPARTVFVDDHPGHTAAARSYGYRAVTFTGAAELRDRLRSWGVRVATAGAPGAGTDR